jgi:hypothetical protein
MQPLVELAITSERCSPFRQSFLADPIGSAGAYDAFLCIEVPLPWERDISLHDTFFSLSEHGAAASLQTAEHRSNRKPFASLTGPDGRRWRPQGLVADSAGSAGAIPESASSGTASPNALRVLAFEKRPIPSDPSITGPAPQVFQVETAAPFDRREWLIDPAQVVSLARALVNADEPAIAAFAQYQVMVAADVIDLLICTHGKRDVCCGQAGMALYSTISSLLGEAPSPVRVWRASHTGGHRFAPTALTFPDGYAWAYLDEITTAQILNRSARPVVDTPPELTTVGEHCRGVSSLSAGPAQVADRAALLHAGWAWAETSRTVEVVAFDRHSLATTLVVTGTPADGPALSLRVEVQVERHIPQITCGVIDSCEYQVEAVWKVASVKQV